MSHILEIDGLRHSYGQKIVLSDIYLSCKTGTVAALLGRNGCGKSTLLKIIFGSTINNDCSVRLNNEPIKPAYLSSVGVSYLPQFNFLPADITVKKALQFFDLSFSDFVRDLPEFKDKSRSRRDELSGGQCRLLEVYLIIKKPGKFILLDEPFTHIMPLHVALIQNWIKEEKESKGFIISDHSVDAVIPVCDTIYLLKDGKINSCQNREQLIDFGYLNH